METTSPQPPNLYIKINDALRYDYGRDYFGDLDGTFVKGMAHGNCTPESVPTICTGVTPDEHGVTGFYDSPVQKPTVFDLPRVFPEYDTAYFDHPQDPLVRLLGKPPVRKLTDLEPPFVYIERDLATHVPYGISWNRVLGETELPAKVALNIGVGAEATPRSYPDYTFRTDGEWKSGREYMNWMIEGRGDFFADYERGCRQARERFDDHMAYLEAEGWIDDTFVISTADHGEVFGHHDGRPGFWHHTVDCPEVVEVPILFYSREVEMDSMVSLGDLLEIWWPKWPTVRDEQMETEGGRDTKRMSSPADDIAEERLYELGYLDE